ncbi:hypothetical protein [Deinococcus arenicola]|uniref:Uncharacterized protein n=1 Tax=Deinococcus arenicola TaxID=2994950 RepID=A0ABU4DWR3_9DEIO|nr:hypothetical protein [Deinococcus sp. ZS9-10]MDV6376499.1 hypothetical protein [Deinococcus sp. ZS9-10]
MSGQLQSAATLTSADIQHMVKKQTAVNRLADAAFDLEVTGAHLKEFDHAPTSAGRAVQVLMLRVRRASAQQTQRRALRAARAVGFEDVVYYAALLRTDQRCHVFLDGPCAFVDFDLD